jgi:hypothetical protein
LLQGFEGHFLVLQLHVDVLKEMPILARWLVSDAYIHADACADQNNMLLRHPHCDESASQHGRPVQLVVKRQQAVFNTTYALVGHSSLALSAALDTTCGFDCTHEATSPNHASLHGRPWDR